MLKKLIGIWSYPERYCILPAALKKRLPASEIENLNETQHCRDLTLRVWPVC